MAGCCAKDDISLYAGLRQRNICPYATPVRQQKTVLCAGISGVIYMDSSLEQTIDVTDKYPYKICNSIPKMER